MKYIIIISFFCIAAINTIGRSQYFTENQGQIRDQHGNETSVLFNGQCANGLSIQLLNNSFSYQLQQLIAEPSNPLKKESKPYEYKYERIDIQFLNSNKNVTILTTEPLHKETYYLSKKSFKASSYKTITYENIYPHIDVEFTFNEAGNFKYNFIVHPGGKIETIQLRVEGSQQPKITSQNITLSNSIDPLNEQIPLSWTHNGENKQLVDVEYKKIDASTFGFKLAESQHIDTFDALVIDPIPTRLFGTYAGGAQQEQVEDMVLDEEGHAFTRVMPTHWDLRKVRII